MDTNTQEQFKLFIGHGLLFRRGGPKDHPLFSGKIAMPGGRELQVVGHFDHKQNKYDLVLRDFGTWKEVTPHFDLSLPEPDAEIENNDDAMLDEKPAKRVGQIQLGTRKYKIEATRGETVSGTPVIKLRLPQVSNNVVY